MKTTAIKRLYYPLADAARALNKRGYTAGDLLNFGATAQLELLVFFGSKPMEVSGIRAYKPDTEQGYELMPVDFDVYLGIDEQIFFSLKAKDCAAIEMYGFSRVDKFTGAYYADFQFNKLSDFRDRLFHEDGDILFEIRSKKIIANYRPLGVELTKISIDDLFIAGSEVLRLLDGIEISEAEKKKLISEPQDQKEIHGRTKKNTDVLIAALLVELKGLGVVDSVIQKTIMANADNPEKFNETGQLKDSTAYKILSDAKKQLKDSS